MWGSRGGGPIDKKTSSVDSNTDQETRKNHNPFMYTRDTRSLWTLKRFCVCVVCLFFGRVFFWGGEGGVYTVCVQFSQLVRPCKVTGMSHLMLLITEQDKNPITYQFSFSARLLMYLFWQPVSRRWTDRIGFCHTSPIMKRLWRRQKAYGILSYTCNANKINSSA